MNVRTLLSGHAKDLSSIEITALGGISISGTITACGEDFVLIQVSSSRHLVVLIHNIISFHAKPKE